MGNINDINLQYASYKFSMILDKTIQYLKINSPQQNLFYGFYL